MASLKAKRAPIRAAFTRTWNELKIEASKPEVDQLAIKRLKSKLSDRFSLLEKADEEIQSDLLRKETSEEEFTEEFNSALEYIDKFGDIKFVVEELLGKDECCNHSQREVVADIRTPQEIRSKYKLPKLELQKFGGDPIEWLGWWSQFKGIDEDKTLSAELKFQYLIQATVPKSAAHDLVTSFPPTSENYPKAIKYLKSRFGNDKILVEVYVRELLKLVVNNSNNRKSTISTLYDKLQTQLRGLESLGVTSDKYAAMLYPLVESALPDDILKAWQRSMNQLRNEDDDEDQLSLLLKFIRNEVDSEIRLRMARSGLSERVVNSNAYPSAMVSSSSTIDKNNLCNFCKKPGHIKPYCHQFKRFLEKQGQKESDELNENNKEKQNDGRDKEDRSTANVAQLNDKDDYGLSIGNLRENELILDSGCTRHAFHDKKYFKTLDESYRNKIKIANGQCVTAFGIGSVALKLENGNGGVRILTVHNVLYVPSLVGSVLSVSKLTDRNYEVEFNKSIGKLKYNNVIIGVADKIANGLYVMRRFGILK